ncbi:MAG: hypothetical protein V1723_02140 [Candidatus Uhrbacteria bacterium]
MATTNAYDQALTAIRDSMHTLICFPEQVGGDGVGTALGLGRALEALRPGHQIDVVSSGFHPAHLERYSFLPNIECIHERIENIHDLVLRVPLHGAEVRDITHNVRDGHLEIRLTPAVGQFMSEHVEAAITNYKYDLIIVVDAPDLRALGALYERHASFFQTTPIITIDHRAEHERYGQINLINLAAAACAEVGVDLIRHERNAPLDADMATCFLTGILAKTQGLRSPRLTPRTFEMARLLLEAGARRDEIVQHLFRTKTIAQLRLWGRALSRLRTDDERKLAWTVLAQHDFLTIAAPYGDLLEVVEELITNSPQAEVIAIISERPDRAIDVHVRCSHEQHNATALLASLGGTGTSTHAHARLDPQEIVAAERTVLDIVRKQMPILR